MNYKNPFWKKNLWVFLNETALKETPTLNDLSNYCSIHINKTVQDKTRSAAMVCAGSSPVSLKITTFGINYYLLPKHYGFFFNKSTPQPSTPIPWIIVVWQSVNDSIKLEKFIWWTLIPLTVVKILKWLKSNYLYKI